MYRRIIKKKLINPGNQLPGISKKKIRALTIFWTGFTFYTIGFVLSNDDKFRIGPSQLQALQGVGLILVALGGKGFLKFRFDDNYLKQVFTALFVFSLLVIARGFKTDYDFVKKMLFNPFYGMLHYFVPLMIFFPRDIKHYKIIFKFLIIFTFLGFLFILMYYDIFLDWHWQNELGKGLTEILFQFLSLPVTFILLTYIYHSNKSKWITFILGIITIYFLIHRARRGSLFVESISVIAAGFIYLVYTKRTALTIGLLVFILPIVFVISSGVKLPSMFDFLVARGSEDTRSGVEQYMSVSMSKMDWIIGKGLNGTYYSPIVINMETGDYTRDVIETGYLQIVLKGGYISLILLLMILIPAVKNGFFDSKNILSKGAGLFILLWILSLRPMVGNGFTMEYMLVWVSVGICYSKKIRYLSDDDIKLQLKK